MSDQPTVRDVESADAERVRELVESSMTSDYALSPGEIESIVDAEFDPETLRERLEDDDVVAFVAEIDDDGESVVAGFVEASTAVEGGAVRWLHVDPERRGEGVGTALFERILSALAERGVDSPAALALAENTSSGAFFEEFDFEKTDEREVDFGGQTTVEYVFVEGASDEGSGATDTAADAADEGDAESAPDLDATDLPDTVTAADGKTVHLGDERLPGSEGGFVETFVDADRSEQHGYYCLNCESTDVSMDSMEQIRCSNCGNTRKPDEGYDASYL